MKEVSEKPTSRNLIFPALRRLCGRLLCLRLRLSLDDFGRRLRIWFPSGAGDGHASAPVAAVETSAVVVVAAAAAGGQWDGRKGESSPGFAGRVYDQRDGGVPSVLVLMGVWV